MWPSLREIWPIRDTVQPPKVKAIPFLLHASEEPMADISRAHLYTVFTFQAHARLLPSLPAVKQAMGRGPGNGLQVKVSSWLKFRRVIVRSPCPLLPCHSYDSRVIRSKQLRPPSHHVEDSCTHESGGICTSHSVRNELLLCDAKEI